MSIDHVTLMKDGPKKVTLTPVKAIRLKCMECSNFQYSEISNCPIADCALFPYRLGTNPTMQGRNKNKPIGV